jgi:polysaccharide biosynthesis transport protein
LSAYSRTPGTAITVAAPPPDPNLPVVSEGHSHQGMSLIQFVAIFLAYWKQIAIITFVVAALGAVTIKLLSKTYTATTTLLVNSDVTDPLAGRDFPVEMIASYVSTQIEIMTSPIVLLPVVQKLDLVEDKEFSAGFKGSPDALQEFVEKNLATAIQVERGVGGQLLYVSASAKTAMKAAAIANAIADIYIEQDRRRLSEPATERAQRYTEELADLREKAVVAQDKVTAFRNDHNIDDMRTEAPGTALQTLETLQERLLETQTLRRALEAKQSGQLPSDDDPGGATPGEDLKALLDSQLSQLAQLRSTFGPQHPRVRELNAQIAQTRQSLATNSQSRLARAKDLEHTYLQAVAEQETKVQKLRQQQDEGSKLVLELESAKSVYKQALDGFDQIVFQSVAKRTNVNIVNRAVPPLFAAKPNKIKLGLVALVLALGLGVGLPLGYEMFFARRLRCRDDLERDLGIPVLAQLHAVRILARET